MALVVYFVITTMNAEQNYLDVWVLLTGFREIYYVTVALTLSGLTIRTTEVLPQERKSLQR